MKRRLSSVFTILLLGVLVFPLAVDVQQVAAASACNGAAFVADVTIPDDTYIDPGKSFVKTWRLKNVGTCTWNTGYQLVFVSGEQMDGQPAIGLPRFVGSNTTVDLSVTLTAPTAMGTYRGYWELRSSSGQNFGIGGGFTNPFWVEIRVLSATESIVTYDFVAEMCSGQWGYDGGPIPCPVNTSKKDFGYVVKIDNPILENGLSAGQPGLLTIPQNKFNGAIHGAFPVGDIFRGDHFQAIIGCQYGAINCSVNYQLEYLVDSSLITLWRFREQYDGLYYQVDVDLSPIANRKNVEVVLTVNANGPNEGDQPLWIAPRIVRTIGSPVQTPTLIPPTPSQPTVVPTVQTNCTNRAQFITDVTVPDGTIFAPNTAFNKVWRLKNIGTCTWSTSYSTAFVSGERMSAADTPFSQPVSPGQTGDLAVNMTAPSLAGSYRGFWELKNAAGNFFGLGSTFDKPFWVDIKVVGSAPPPTPTSTLPAATGTSSPPTNTPPGPTNTPLSPTNTPIPPTSTGTDTSNWTTYQNVKYGFFFKIPPGSSVASQSDNTGRVYLPFVSGTTLVQKYIDIGVADGQTPCTSPTSFGFRTSVNTTVNGIPFLLQTGDEGAAGNLYVLTGYSTSKVVNNVPACISLVLVLHSLSAGAMATPLPEYDHAAESAVITTIMGTYGNQ